MAKRNVMFSRPDEPDFLKRIKADIGYKEGDTVETKRQRIMDEMEDEDYEEREDEKPQVVVIKSGDLTAEEAEQLEKDEAEKPADLSQRIIFKVKKKEVADDTASKPSDSNKKKDKSRDKKKEKPNKGVLSFNDEDEEEED